MSTLTRPPKATSCDGKRRMQRRQAQRAARLQRDRGHAVHAYPCPYCRQGAWHVGADWDQ